MYLETISQSHKWKGERQHEEESASVEENVEVSLEDEVFVAEEDSVSENEPAYTGDTWDDRLYIYQYKMEEANVEYTDDKCITMRLLDNKVNEMNATGKTYNLKFNVYYWDGAVNEKPATFTVKVDVR